MIQITGLTKAYRRGRPPALLDLTFDARPGMVTVLLGDEGAGKSTALRLMVELERGHGLTLFDGRTYRRIRRPEREIGVLLPAGRPEAGHPGQRARAHLRMLAGAVGVPARRADDLLEQTRLAAVADHRIGTFSPGMHRRLALAAALLGNPSTLLLDAPTEGLSPSNEEWFGAFLRSFALSGGTVLTTTRAPEEAAALADRVITLDTGRLAADQPVAEFRRTRLYPEVLVRGPQMARLADLLVAQGGQVRRDGGAGLAVSGIDRTEIGELAYRNGILLHELADRVVRRPVAYPSALPTGSGRSGRVSVRTVRQGTARPEENSREENSREENSREGAEREADVRDAAGQPTADSGAPRPATVGRPAGPEPERLIDHRNLQAGRWAAAALVPDPSVQPQPQTQTQVQVQEQAKVQVQAQVSTGTASVPAPAPPAQAVPAPASTPVPAPEPTVDLTRRTPRGASALGRPAASPAEPAPVGQRVTETRATETRVTETRSVEAVSEVRGGNRDGDRVARPDVAEAEHLSANPTDAELLTPARIRGVGRPQAPTPVRPMPGRPWSAGSTGLRPAEPAGRSREPGAADARGTAPGGADDENGSE
ncbi:ATP-binding cassette domain-containing protein [Kitasatospora sp. NA04385]|uniref:ATP-binding cassette domain-containing protein n=1 Tax=Kitasatospora sp. NA04385 TaxID=2742135 RepID=UPI001592AEF1|nr:ATP-binding cassette domain-containing protein [Kitasatospora sp. NA04385]QKW21893.1 ATP-binding cassette domain-containing protein [Kitasatospora sp. NA04385]